MSGYKGETETQREGGEGRRVFVGKVRPWLAYSISELGACQRHGSSLVCRFRDACGGVELGR